MPVLDTGIHGVGLVTWDEYLTLPHATTRSRCLRDAVDTRVKPWHDGGSGTQLSQTGSFKRPRNAAWEASSAALGSMGRGTRCVLI